MTKHEIREVFIHSIAEQYENHGERIPSWLHIGDIEFEVEEQEPFKPMAEIDLYSVIKQEYIEREILNKIRAEIEYTMKYQYAIGDDQYAEGFEKSLEIIDKYKAESED
ncbi:MAG: hypothetical protein IKP50_00190 [Bacilli bacterium]|nr:hypothetical protein [Bacilli bacterium]